MKESMRVKPSFLVCLVLLGQFSESVSGVPVVSSHEDRVPESLEKEEVDNLSASPVAVDRTLLIVSPIAGGIFLMVLVFFFYLATEKNVEGGEDLFGYQNLDEDDEPIANPEGPSTSAAAING